jgi:hypothetical protein
MGSTTIQARFGERQYSIGRLVLDRARALGMSRSELVRHLGYPHVGKGHRALSELLTTGKIAPLIAQHLAGALEVDEELVASVMAATAQQQRDEACQRTLARETAYRTAFKPHLRCETTRTIPEPIFIAALLGTARLRHVEVSSEVWNASADDREGLVKRAIQDHYGERDGYVPAFGAIVSYTLVTTPGYLADYGFPFDTNGDRMGSIRPVERVGEAVLGTKRGDARLTGLFRDTPIVILT